MFFETKKKDWYFIIPASAIFLIALLVTFWDFFMFQKATYQLRFVNITGLVMCVLGVAIRIMARKTLGKSFTCGLKIPKDHRLTKSGIYKHIRHPAYTGSMLFSEGLPLVFNSVLGFLVMLPLLLFFLYRIRIEEDMFIREFGDEYREYRLRSKKLIPYIY